MIHRFYSLTSSQQRWFQLKLAIGFIALNLVIGLFLMLIGLPFLSFFMFAVSLSVFAPFVDVPLGVKSGNLHYYSPLLIGEKIRNNRLVLHSGSLFDYYFVINKEHSVGEIKKQVFSAYVDGLLTLINEYENKQPTEISIKATSYILNVRTARKLGLKLTSPDRLQRLILYFNYINLTCALSLLNKKITWPNIQKMASYEGKLDTLINKKNDLILMRNRFKK
jgi:hypothetical protein